MLTFVVKANTGNVICSVTNEVANCHVGRMAKYIIIRHDRLENTIDIDVNRCPVPFIMHDIRRLNREELVFDAIPTQVDHAGTHQGVGRLILDFAGLLIAREQICRLMGSKLIGHIREPSVLRCDRLACAIPCLDRSLVLLLGTYT